MFLLLPLQEKRRSSRPNKTSHRLRKIEFFPTRGVLQKWLQRYKSWHRMEHLVEMEGHRCVAHNQEWHPKKEDKRHNRGHNLLGPQHLRSGKSRKTRCCDNATCLGIGCSKFNARVPKVHDRKKGSCFHTRTRKRPVGAKRASSLWEPLSLPWLVSRHGMSFGETAWTSL
jgi:hypothetical protein